jgi:hypothetical protein
MSESVRVVTFTPNIVTFRLTSWQANSCSASQNSTVLWNPEFHYGNVYAISLGLTNAFHSHFHQCLDLSSGPFSEQTVVRVSDTVPLSLLNGKVFLWDHNNESALPLKIWTKLTHFKYIWCRLKATEDHPNGNGQNLKLPLCTSWRHVGEEVQLHAF